MRQVLTPENLRIHLIRHNRISKRKIMEHFQADEKMLDYILAFWSRHGMIRLVSADCPLASPRFIYKGVSKGVKHNQTEVWRNSQT